MWRGAGRVFPAICFVKQTRTTRSIPCRRFALAQLYAETN
jgi:hypothetical protein